MSLFCFLTLHKGCRGKICHLSFKASRLHMLRTISKLNKFYDKIYLILIYCTSKLILYNRTRIIQIEMRWSHFNLYYPGPVIEYLGVLLIDYFFPSDQTEKLAVLNLLKMYSKPVSTLHLLSNIVNTWTVSNKLQLFGNTD